MTRDHFRPSSHSNDHFILATVVGSHPPPDWFDALRSTDGGVAAEHLKEAADDCCRLAIHEYERAGLDVVTDGELRRNGMVEHFTQFIDGYEAGDGTDDDWNAHMPTVVEELSTRDPWLVDDFQFATSVAKRPVKTTIPGPFTFASFCTPDAYPDVESTVEAFTELVRAEVSRLIDAGARWIQLDEPALGMSPHVEIASESVSAIAAAVPDDVRLGLHVCSGNYDTLAPAIFDFAVDEVDLEFASDDADDIERVIGGVDLGVDVSVGVVASADKAVESVATIERNIESALEVVPSERLTVTPDCGLKPLPRSAARDKVTNLVEATRAVEARLDAGELTARPAR